MNLQPTVRRLAGALCGSLVLLGATSAATDTMYLRLSATGAAPAVSGLSYDAIATVPQSPGIPADLLPRDYVVATLVATGAAGNPLADGGRSRHYNTWTVVETSPDGNVVRRTTFRDVAISSIHPVSASDGLPALRVRFTAASVVVSEPSNVVARAGAAERR